MSLASTVFEIHRVSTSSPRSLFLTKGSTTKIGPGCFERVYEEILYYEHTKLGFNVQRQLLLPIEWEKLFIKDAYKIDLLVENKLVIELKSIFPLPPVHFNQVHTHLSLLNLKHGMLINFKVPLMKEGLHRIFNNSGMEELE